MIRTVYTRTITILKRIPVKLWGLSLLNALLLLLVPTLGVNLPVISIPVCAALEVGMAVIYYHTYSVGDVPDTKMMFAAFKDFKTFLHVAGGMCWMYLWLLIWALIPIAGPVIAVYKAIQFMFTPYILIEENQVGAMDAIKKSKEYTKGYKAKILLGVILPVIGFVVAIAVFTALSFIPAAGGAFMIITAILTLAFSLFAPLFFGLVQAGYYEYCKLSITRH